MSEAYDVIVVGLGAMGTAACDHLARRGARVLGLERFGIPNTRGSSHGDSRLMRLCYSEHADYVPLLRRTFELWRELERETGIPLFIPSGVLYVGRTDEPLLEGTLRSAAEHDLTCEQLGHDELRARYPMFEPHPEQVGVVEVAAGVLIPERCITAHATRAIEHGAELRTFEQVHAWREDGAGVAVETDGGTHRAERLVVTAGAWAPALLAEHGVELSVTRQPLWWMAPHDGARRYRPDAFPVWAFDRGDGSLLYGFPIMDSRPGLKVAIHAPGAPADPDRLDQTPTVEEERDLRRELARSFPAANGATLSRTVCMYTYSRDTHFIIDRHPRHERVIMATGFSGHGFKFAAVMGEALADLATTGTTGLPARFLGLGRFA